MPQVAKTEEQRVLESRISRTRTMLANMQGQLRSLRSRNKAARERERRQNNVSSKKQKADQSFDDLCKEIAAEKAKVAEYHAKYKNELAQLGIDADLHDLHLNAVLGVSKMSTRNPDAGAAASSNSKTTSEQIDKSIVAHPKSTPAVVDDGESEKQEKDQTLELYS